MLSRGRIQLLIIAVAAVLFIPGLGAVHLFDWDEINFAEIAREMLVTGDWLQPQINYLPFHEKPPLFIWFQAVSMSAFGVNEFAARLPNAICGIVTLLVLFRIGTRIKNQTFGLLWVLAYIGSILPHLYFRSGIIDPWFNLFIFLGIDQFI
ncbi:MAG TPA: glycosyltransferase family 39 protein, partial [Flavobacteriales bacterium]|nr:glycosyltransferase family 39 protein [Flavobacteriales bacterium]